MATKKKSAPPKRRAVRKAPPMPFPPPAAPGGMGGIGGMGGPPGMKKGGLVKKKK